MSSVGIRAQSAASLPVRTFGARLPADPQCRLHTRAPASGSEVAKRFSSHYHGAVLALAAAVVLMAAMLEVSTSNRVVFRCLPNLPLPQTCMSQTVLGRECPGCGLTRSFVYLARGDWQASLASHRMGWLLMATAVLQLPYRLWALWTREDEPLGRRLPSLFAVGLVALLIGNWMVKIYLETQQGP